MHIWVAPWLGGFTKHKSQTQPHTDPIFNDLNDSFCFPMVTMLSAFSILWCLIALGPLFVFAVGDPSSDNSFRKQCLSFRPQRLIFNSTLTRLEYITSGTKINLDDNVQSCNRPSQQVSADICRIALQIPTSKRSSISFELWLPQKWEGSRYLATGNGGVDGCEYSPDTERRC